MTLDEIADELDTIGAEMAAWLGPDRFDAGDPVTTARREYCLAVAIHAVTAQAKRLRDIAGVVTPRGDIEEHK